MNMDVKTINVAMFPAGSEVSLEALRSLQHISHFSVIGLNSVKDYSEVAFDRLVEGLPYYWDENFIKELSLVVAENNI